MADFRDGQLLVYCGTNTIALYAQVPSRRLLAESIQSIIAPANRPQLGVRRANFFDSIRDDSQAAIQRVNRRPLKEQAALAEAVHGIRVPSQDLNCQKHDNLFILKEFLAERTGLELAI